MHDTWKLAIVRRLLHVAACAILTTLARDAHAEVSQSIVISQVYGGGGNAGATYKNDFIELFNRGTTPVSLAGWSVQYASSTGSTWQVTTLSGTLAPGQYYLIQEAQGSGGSVVLPTPDASGMIAMSATTGKVVLASTTAPLNGLSCPGAAQNVVDFLGFGGAVNCSETSPAAALTNTSAALRRGEGCVESDNNAADFNAGVPLPRNTSFSAHNCEEAAPAVSTTSPGNGASDVPVGSSVVITFSEAVNVAADAVRIECPPGNVVASQPNFVGNVSQVTLTPAAPLPASTSCRIVVVASGISDVDVLDPPDTMLADLSSTFVTAAAASCAAADTPIGAIQGSGTSAALTGVRTVQGVVVADFEYPGTGANTDYLRGFFMQNSPGGADGDPATSDAIFVFNGNNDNVSVGQIVQVKGTVTEYDFNSVGGTITELTGVTLEVCGGSETLTPVDVALPLDSAAALERFEGMLVRFPQRLYVSEHFQLGRFGQMILSSGGRLEQPTHTVTGCSAVSAKQAANALNQIVLDDATQIQNPDPIRFGGGSSPLSAQNSVRAGDSVVALQGVLTQSDATSAGNVPATSDPVRYRLRPFNVLNGVTPNFESKNPRPSAPTVTGTLKIAGFNLLNYFNTFGDCSCRNGVDGAVSNCRGAENAQEFDRQWTKTVAAALGTGADVLVVNELENDGYAAGSSIQDLVDKLNAASAPGTYTFIDADARTGQLNALGDDAIRVAMIYKPARAVPIGQTAVANTGAFGHFQLNAPQTECGRSTTELQRSRPALAQAFRDAQGGRVVVVGNHLKSKGSACDDNVSPVGPDPDLGCGQGNCNLTRVAATQQLATWLGTYPTGIVAGTLILGDLNSYAQEEPVQALENAGYTDLLELRLGTAAYSYVFDGQWGYLDHALASPDLLPQISDVVEWHINSDEAAVLDYNTNFKSTAQISSLYAPDQFRASDHDPVVVGLTLAPQAAAVPLGNWAVPLLGLLLVGFGWQRLRTLKSKFARA